MRIDIVTVLPDVFGPVLDASILGRAQTRGIIDIAVHDLRDWTEDRHRTTDDYPFGGGPGMVMKVEPVYRALDTVAGLHEERPFVVVMSPQGRTLDQALVRELASHPRLVVLCGRYEGFDERIRCPGRYRALDRRLRARQGESCPASCARSTRSRVCSRVPVGCSESATDESFSEGLLEYPQYTRPAVFDGMGVPEVLVSGDHARIAAWRRRESLRRTAERRPDLLRRVALSIEESDFVNTIVQEESADRD